MCGSDDEHQILIVNTSTLEIEHAARWEHGRRARRMRFTNPSVSASAFACVIRGPAVQLLFADPLGGSPRYVVDVSPNDLASNQANNGPVNDDARVFVKGKTVYVVRVPIQGRKNVNVTVFGVTYEGLDTHDPTDGGGAGDVFHMRTKETWLPGSLA